MNDGTEAIAAYLKAIHPTTSAAWEAEIAGQLRAHRALDTVAMVRS